HLDADPCDKRKIDEHAFGDHVRQGLDQRGAPRLHHLFDRPIERAVVERSGEVVARCIGLNIEIGVEIDLEALPGMGALPVTGEQHDAAEEDAVPHAHASSSAAKIFSASTWAAMSCTRMMSTRSRTAHRFIAI